MDREWKPASAPGCAHWAGRALGSGSATARTRKGTTTQSGRADSASAAASCAIRRWRCGWNSIRSWLTSGSKRDAAIVPRFVVQASCLPCSKTSCLPQAECRLGSLHQKLRHTEWAGWSAGGQGCAHCGPRCFGVSCPLDSRHEHDRTAAVIPEATVGTTRDFEPCESSHAVIPAQAGIHSAPHSCAAGSPGDRARRFSP